MKGKAPRPPLRGAKKRNALAEANLPLAHWWAARRAGDARRLDDDDARQVASLGLLRAAELYDPASGYKFTTYAGYWIRQFLMRAGRYAPVVRCKAKKGRPPTCFRLDPDRHDPVAPEGPCPSEVDEVCDALRFLGPRLRHVIELRFLEGWTLEEIGQELGVTRERVRQLERQALDKLRRALGGGEVRGGGEA